jgi:hypothetical protein
VWTFDEMMNDMSPQERSIVRNPDGSREDIWAIAKNYVKGKYSFWDLHDRFQKLSIYKYYFHVNRAFLEAVQHSSGDEEVVRQMEGKRHHPSDTDDSDEYHAAHQGKRDGRRRKTDGTQHAPPAKKDRQDRKDRQTAVATRSTREDRQTGGATGSTRENRQTAGATGSTREVRQPGPQRLRERPNLETKPQGPKVDIHQPGTTLLEPTSLDGTQRDWFDRDPFRKFHSITVTSIR